MTTYLQLKQKVIRLLGDVINEDSSPLEGTIYLAPLLEDAVHAALKRISSRVWKNSIHVNETAGILYSLPSDLLDIVGVFDIATGMFLPSFDFSPGQVLGSSGNSWMSYPGNSVTLLNEAASGIKIYHTAHWTLPDSDGDALECPEICVTALSIYAASYCLVNAAVQSGDVAQFKTKVDAGTPTQIPAKELSDWLLRRFESELATLSMKQRN